MPKFEQGDIDVYILDPISGGEIDAVAKISRAVMRAPTLDATWMQIGEVDLDEISLSRNMYVAERSIGLRNLTMVLHTLRPTMSAVYKMAFDVRVPGIEPLIPPPVPAATTADGGPPERA